MKHESPEKGTDFKADRPTSSNRATQPTDKPWQYGGREEKSHNICFFPHFSPIISHFLLLEMSSNLLSNTSQCLGVGGQLQVQRGDTKATLMFSLHECLRPATPPSMALMRKEELTAYLGTPHTHIIEP